MSCSQMSGYSVMPSASFLQSSGAHASGRRKLVKTGFMVLCLCLAVLSSLFSPSSANAAGSFGSNGYGSGYFTSADIKLLKGSYNCTTYSSGGHTLECGLPSGNNTFQGLDVYTSADVNANAILTMYVTVAGLNLYEGQIIGGFSTQAGWSVIDQQIVTGNANTQTITYLLKLQRAPNGSSKIINLVPYGKGIVYQGALSGATIYIGGYSWEGTLDAQWFVQQMSQIGSINDYAKQIASNGITAKVDNSGVISAVNSASQNQVNATNQNTQAVNNAANQAHKDSQNQIASQDKTTEAVNAQTEQDKQQYEQEKQEESDREEQGKSDMDDATGIFNFNLLNPFAGIFGLFKPPTTCASIPTISRWLHSDTSTVCTWWSSDVISVLTPVFGIFSMMIVFGFLVHWLTGSAGNGSLDIGWDADWYGPHSGEVF